MNTLGNETKTLFLKGFSGQLPHEEFTANSAVKAGQLVKLTTDGQIDPIAAGNATTLAIGVALFDAGADETVTVCLRGIGIIYAEGSASMDAGIVKYASFTSGTGRNRFAAASATATVYTNSDNTATVTGTADGGGAVTGNAALDTAIKYVDPEMIGWSLDASTDAGDEVRVLIRN